jgi:hypothetical protein
MIVGSSSNGWRGNGEHIWKAGSGVCVIVGVLVEVGEGEGVFEGFGSGVFVLRAVGLTGKITWVTTCGCGAQLTIPMISSNPKIILSQIIAPIISVFDNRTQAGLPEKL